MAETLPACLESYKAAAAYLQRGALVALPTETVYGLAGIASNSKAVSNIYKVKNRPADKRLSQIILQKDAAHKIALVSPLARGLIDRFWPGPLTLVLPLRADKNQTIALRCPDTDWARAFAGIGFTQVLVLPSANISGDKPPSTAAQVETILGDKIALIIDGGKTQGRASTILSIKNDHITLLRAGALLPEDLAPYNIELGP